ncbi:MAG: class I SAM-dependent methyltransferase [Alphaproteobacteria bacterium]|nr:class I SAM-dependent methyltransferase [Alphaproteobacteria bacterium]
MSSLVDISRHFDERASGYHPASLRPPWRWVRDLESRAVLQALGDVEGQEVLELGCGAGFYTRLLAERGAARIVAVDASAAMVDQLPAGRVRGVVGDAATVDVGGPFSLLLSAGMLEFVPDPVAVLANAARHARAGARLVVLVPPRSLGGRMYARHYRTRGIRVNLFGAPELRALAQRTGWASQGEVTVHPFALVATLRRD